MNKNKLAQVFHFDLFGRREEKYDFLLQHSIDNIQWSELEVREPNYFLVKKDFCSNESYKIGFSICDLFPVNNTGIETGRDDFFIDWNNELLSQKVRNVFLNKNDNNLSSRFKITNTTSFRFKENLSNSEYTSGRVQKILYRPFDFRFIYYDQKLLRRASYNTIKHLMQDNLAITSCRQQSTFDFQHILISNCIIERCTVSLQTKETGYVFPLYLYPEPNAQQTIDQSSGRVPNLNMEIVGKIASIINHAFLEDENIVCDLAEGIDGTFSPLDILDYIYAVLHSPSYREKYKKFLKIDFPRVPYPKDKETFWQLVELGGEIRQIHLLESPVVNNFITKYPVGGSNEVGKVRYEISENAKQDIGTSILGRVWINDEQYFANVPQVAWEFYIGGYQPAQKWLKDRKGRELQIEDILHYQKIIVALYETERLMKEIDKIFIE